MDHAAHRASTSTRKSGSPASALPTRPGQDAYGAIAEIVRLLESDSTTDWSKVDLERLRQHLIDMNAVTLRSSVTQRAVAGGLQMEVTGDEPATQEAIRRMTAAHAKQLPTHGVLMTVEPIARGARLVATARDSRDFVLIAKIRGLGFIGLLALGDHHAPHHLAMARGGSAGGHESH
jgi:hypothetical protein